MVLVVLHALLYAALLATRSGFGGRFARRFPWAPHEPPREQKPLTAGSLCSDAPDVLVQALAIDV
ncbi:hypothetical protein SAMN05216238_102370 [Lentibacillus persicus]|uniref:Uncharacterized protein n=1 Tax=Lentibacillus persicus TaxID=640948 RepID=A0A1I1TNS0_9BACI|nr:hypothetical protein SAMN05216238_102370 [Lentibacillus persicus]